MSYSLDDVERALALPSDAFEGQQEAQALIMEWLDSDGVLMQMVEILTRSDDRYVRFKIGSAMQGKIPYLWGSYSNEDRATIRQELVNQIQRMIDIEDVLWSLSVCVGLIASFDMPNDWEEFYQFCFAQDDYTPPQILSCLYILRAYCEQIETITYISRKHKIINREDLLEHEDAFIHTIQLGFNDPVTNPVALHCLNHFLQWAQLGPFVPDLIKKLLFQDLCTEGCQEAACECLNTIFISRDEITYYKDLAPLVIIAMSTLKDPKNPNLPITNSSKILDFLTFFMISFKDMLSILTFQGEKAPNPEYSKQLELMKEEEMKEVVEMGYDSEQFIEMVKNLFVVILSTNSPTNAFWELWRSVFSELNYQKGPFYHTDISSAQIFEPMIPMIRENIYRVLEYSQDETDGSCPSYVRIAFAELIRYDIEGMDEFLKSQEPSISLCFALASINECFDPQPLDEDVPVLLTTVMESISEDSSDNYISAFLCAVSHVEEFIQSNSSVFLNIIQYLLQSISEGTPKVTNAATQALVNIIKPSITFISENLETLATEIIQESESFVANLDRNNLILLYVSCSMLILTIHSEEESNASIQTLFAPIVQILSDFYSDPTENLDQAIVACDVIQSCAIELYSKAAVFLQLFIEPLMAILPNILNVPEFSTLSDYVLTALARLIALQCDLSLSDAVQLFNSILELLPGTREAQESVFRFISLCRMYIPSLDSSFESYYSTFIEPVLQFEAPPLEAIAKMVASFSLKVVPQDFLVELEKQCLEVLDTNANIAGINLWSQFMRDGSNTEIGKQLMDKTLSEILPTTYAAIVSTLHSSCYDELGRFFAEMISYLRNNEQKEAIVEHLSQVFREIQDESEENLYTNFLEYILDSVTPKYKIKMALTNLLAVLRRSSPCDSESFKRITPRRHLLSMLFPFGNGDSFLMPPEIRVIPISCFIPAPFTYVKTHPDSTSTQVEQVQQENPPQN